MSQVNGFKGFVGYSIRELDSNETNVYCLDKNLYVSSFPFSSTKINFTSDFTLRTYTSGCYYYDVETGKWSSNGIDVYEDTNLTQTHCISSHLTSFAGGLVIFPSTINFQTAFSNASPAKTFVVYILIFFLSALYILSIIWARWMDLKDSKKLNLTFIDDNCPGDRYFYELIVFTGEKDESGTNSKVNINFT